MDILQFELKIVVYLKEVTELMTKNKNSNNDRNNNKGKKATSVTPQGYGDTEFAEEPKSELEEIAKKKNTK